METEEYNLKLVNFKENKINLIKNFSIFNNYKFLVLLYIILNYFYFIYIFSLSKKEIQLLNNNITEIIKIAKNLSEQKEILEINEKNIFKSNNSIYKKEIYSKLEILKLITNNNYLKYKGAEKCLLHNQDNEFCIYYYIYPKKVIGKKRILIGKKRDGCYVLLDDFKDIRIAYSFGISKMIQFDQGLADRDIDVYMYDHTINSLPYNNSRFHWKKIGIAGKKNTNNQLKTLEELIKENGHSLEKNMILKIDVEHSEWDSLKDIPDNILNQFKYILIEFHFRDTKKAQLYYEVIKKLHKNHQVFYLRCNRRNNIITFGNNRICKSLEVSYIIRKDNHFIKDDSIYPIFEFDYTGANLNGKSEINLNILKLFDFDDISI